MLLTWVRSKQRGAQNAFRRTGTFRRNSESSEPRAVEIRQNQSSCAPFALGFLRDAATTAPRHPPSFVTRSRVATAHARQRCVRPTFATRIVKDEHPCDRYLSTFREFPRVASMGCAVHAAQPALARRKRLTGGVLFPRGRSLQLASGVSSFLDRRPNWPARLRGTKNASAVHS